MLVLITNQKLSGFKVRSSFDEKINEVQPILVAVLLKVINFKGIGGFKLTWARQLLLCIVL